MCRSRRIHEARITQHTRAACRLRCTPPSSRWQPWRAVHSDAAASRHTSASDPIRFTCAPTSLGAVSGFELDASVVRRVHSTIRNAWCCGLTRSRCSRDSHERRESRRARSRSAGSAVHLWCTCGGLAMHFRRTPGTIHLRAASSSARAHARDACPARTDGRHMCRALSSRRTCATRTRYSMHM